MNQLTNYIKGTATAEEQEKIVSALIAAKLDRDKKREWVSKLERDFQCSHSDNSGIKKMYRKNWFLFSIAASLLFLIAVYFISPGIFQAKTQAAVERQIAELSIMGDQSMLRKGSASIDFIRSEATKHYVNADFKKSELEWEKLVTAQQATQSDYLYLGICQLKKVPSNPAAAVAALQNARGLESHQAEISWTLALAYLKAGEQAEGLKLLKDIASKQDYKAAEAEALLALYPS